MYNLIWVKTITLKSEFPYYKIKNLLSNRPLRLAIWRGFFVCLFGFFVASFFLSTLASETKPKSILDLKLRLLDS